MLIKTFKIAQDRREAKVRGNRGQIKVLNTVFQRETRKDKQDYYNKLCKEIEENNKKEEHGSSSTKFGKSKENLKHESVCSKTTMKAR